MVQCSNWETLAENLNVIRIFPSCMYRLPTSEIGHAAGRSGNRIAYRADGGTELSEFLYVNSK